MIKLFQTIASKKNNIWHIIKSEDKSGVYPLCNVMGYWIGGYHKDKPNMTRENMSEINFTGKEKLCPACVAQAYKKGLIRIKEI